MKNIKTFLITVFAVGIISFLFAFKNDAPVKEYGTIQFWENNKRDAIIVNLAGEIKNISTETPNDEKKFLEVLNSTIAAGWTLAFTDYTSTGPSTKRIIYLERVKQ